MLNPEAWGVVATLRHTFDVAFLASESTDTFLEKFGLRVSDSPLSFVAYFLEQGFEFTPLQCREQGNVIGLDLKFIDRDGQFHPTVELDHFSVLHDLLASIGHLLPGSHAFYLVDIIQQRLQPAEFANQCSSGFATQANAWNVIDRVAGQGEHIADKGRRNVPFCSDLI